MVDPSADKDGRFRVIIARGKESWPESRFIRQGTSLNSWILLNNVPLGFELWRQFNAFPIVPVINGGKKAKEDKE
jgi:hypothetical protein